MQPQILQGLHKKSRLHKKLSILHKNYERFPAALLL